jgi:hypothetical protein
LLFGSIRFARSAIDAAKEKAVPEGLRESPLRRFKKRFADGTTESAVVEIVNKKASERYLFWTCPCGKMADSVTVEDLYATFQKDFPWHLFEADKIRNCCAPCRTRIAYLFLKLTDSAAQYGDLTFQIRD